MYYLFEFSFSHISGAKIIKITENGKRKTENFCFSVFACSVKTEPTPNREQRANLFALCRGAKEEKPAKQD